MARPRVLDIDKAMETATNFFWKNGYERTSVADLTQAMGITPPSFYFAFGSKDGLFRMVLERYYEMYLGAAEEALKEPTSRRVAEGILTRLADIYTDPSHPLGCLAIKCALSGSQTADALAERQAELRAARRGRLKTRLEEAIATGDLPHDADADELARYVLVLGTGLALDAQAGATRLQLRQTIARAMMAWP